MVGGGDRVLTGAVLAAVHAELYEIAMGCHPRSFTEDMGEVKLAHPSLARETIEADGLGEVQRHVLDDAREPPIADDARASIRRRETAP